jgi:hypothetical protein
MPRFFQPKSRPYALFDIETEFSSEQLSEVLDQPISDKTKSVWYPKLNRNLGDCAWIDTSGLKPQYPIYILSKGRPQCITARALEKMGLDFKIVIEESDKENYAKWDRYLHVGNFVNDTKCSIPVRNYIDEICQSEKYWLIDDNIEDFNYLTDNNKYVCRSPVMFRAAEDFCNRFSNIGQAGFNYYSFAKKTEAVSPIYLNTRIYSCTLMYKNVENVRVHGKLWRGRYNEDTDLSLRILKAGYCTVLFNSFLAGKITTQRVSGGNTDNVYIDNDDRRKFAESLKKQHPDLVDVVWKFKRWHHKVDYSQFTQELQYTGSHEPVNYGLVLKEGAR